MVVHDKSNVRVVFFIFVAFSDVDVAVAATIWVVALTLAATGAATGRGETGRRPKGIDTHLNVSMRIPHGGAQSTGQDSPERVTAQDECVPRGKKGRRRRRRCRC